MGREVVPLISSRHDLRARVRHPYLAEQGSEARTSKPRAKTTPTDRTPRKPLHIPLPTVSTAQHFNITGRAGGEIEELREFHGAQSFSGGHLQPQGASKGQRYPPQLCGWLFRFSCREFQPGDHGRGGVGIPGCIPRSRQRRGVAHELLRQPKVL